MNSCPPIERLGGLIRGELSEAEGRRRWKIIWSLWGLPRPGAYPVRMGDVGGPSTWPSMTRIGARSLEMLDRLARRGSSSGGEASDSGDRRHEDEASRRRLPAELPGFRVIREVGRGGMGTVYRAGQLGLDRPVALKILSRGPDGRRRGAGAVPPRGAALARLHHPNVVRIYGRR